MKADMNTHTVSVVFDDASMSIDDVVAALTEAGYAVPKYDLVN